MVAPGIILAAAMGALVGYTAAAARIRRLRAAYHRAAWRAEHDLLTGLPQRGRAAAAVQANLAAGRATTLILVDLDRFKQVNDTHGHQIGDQLLVTVARRIHLWATGRRGLACRLSGDEFLIVIPATPHTAAAHLDVPQLLARIAEPVTVDTATVTTLRVSATAGIATSNCADAVGWSQLLRRADIALYQARYQHLPHTTYQAGMHMPAPTDRNGPRLRDQRR